MKNTIKLFGIIAFIAVMGFGMAACDGDNNRGSTPPSLNGTWANTEGEGTKLVLNNGSITVSFGTGAQTIEAMKGAYVVTSGTSMTVTFTQVNGDQLSSWLEEVLQALEQSGQTGASMLQVTLNATQLYTEVQFKAAIVTAVVAQWSLQEAAASGMVDNMFTPDFHSPFSTETIPYNLSGNTLTVTMGDPIVFTRQ